MPEWTTIGEMLVSKNLCQNRVKVFRSFHTTVLKLWHFTAIILSQKFHENNFLLKNFSLNWFDEKTNNNAWQWIPRFSTLCTLHTTVWKNEIFYLVISLILISKTIAFTKFLRKKCEREFLQFTHCEYGEILKKRSRPKNFVKSTL